MEQGKRKGDVMAEGKQKAGEDVMGRGKQKADTGVMDDEQTAREATPE